MKKLNILKTLLFLPTLSIIPFSFISHQPTTLINKTSSLTTVGDTFTIIGGETDFGGVGGTLTFTVLSDPSGNEPGTAEISSQNFFSGDLKVQPTVTNNGKTYNVVSFSSNVFGQNNTGILTVEFLTQTISLGHHCFAGAPNLTKISSPILVSAIFSNQAFESCNRMTVIDFPTLMSLNTSNSCFASCGALETVNMPNLRSAEFGYDSFSSDKKIVVFSLPLLTHVIFGPTTFQSCSGLTTVDFPNLETGVFGNFLFQGDTLLAKVNIPKFSGSFGTYAFGYCYVLPSIDLPGLTEGSVLGSNLFQNNLLLSQITFGAVDPTQLTFGSSWISGTNTSGNGVDFYVPYTTLDKWQQVYTASSGSWGNSVNFISYIPAIAHIVTQNKLVERSPSSSAILTITQAEFYPDLSTLSADLGKSGLSISSFEDGVAIIKTNKASAGTKHIIISCAGCEDLDVTVVVAHNFNSYLWIILSFSIGLGITLGAAIFFFVDKKRKQQENK